MKKTELFYFLFTNSNCASSVEDFGCYASFAEDFLLGCCASLYFGLLLCFWALQSLVVQQFNFHASSQSLLSQAFAVHWSQQFGCCAPHILGCRAASIVSLYSLSMVLLPCRHFHLEFSVWLSAAQAGCTSGRLRLQSIPIQLWLCILSIEPIWLLWHVTWKQSCQCFLFSFQSVAANVTSNHCPWQASLMARAEGTDLDLNVDRHSLRIG